MYALIWAALPVLVFSGNVNTIFIKAAAKKKVDPVVLEGICRYESGSGRSKLHHNKNGTWDVGYCQNHRYAKQQPRIPTNRRSIREAAGELAYWKRKHQKICVELVRDTGKCYYVRYGKRRGVRNCKRPHPWWEHYNHGYRVLRNNYGKKVQCSINNNFKKCKEKQWKQISF